MAPLRPVARGMAWFFGTFSLLNFLGELRARGFDANGWWIDFRPLPAAVGNTVLLLTAVALLAFAARPDARPWRKQLTTGLLLGILAISVGNATQFFILLARGTIRSSFPVPLSLLVGAAVAVILRALLRPPAPRSRALTGWRAVVLHDRSAIAATVAACALLFPLAQMFCFGKTDYRRRADAAVVFGARAYRDGRCSDALADRVRTACDLFHRGLVTQLIFSGGPGDGPTDEPTAMRNFAVSLGVPARVIRLDAAGLNTDDTARNTAGPTRLLAVSHFYHLPRVKLTYQRLGVNVLTVPAVETYTLTQMPWLITREVAALWVYYLRPLTR